MAFLLWQRVGKRYFERKLSRWIRTSPSAFLRDQRHQSICSRLRKPRHEGRRISEESSERQGCSDRRARCSDECHRVARESCCSNPESDCRGTTGKSHPEYRLRNETPCQD